MRRSAEYSQCARALATSAFAEVHPPCESFIRERSGSSLGFVVATPPASEVVKPLAKLGLESTIGRIIVFAIDSKIVLVDPASFGIVRILVTLAVAEAFRPLVMAVFQVYRHGNETVLANVAERL